MDLIRVFEILIPVVAFDIAVDHQLRESVAVQVTGKRNAEGEGLVVAGIIADELVLVARCVVVAVTFPYIDANMVFA